MDGFLSKPIIIEEVIDTLQKNLLDQAADVRYDAAGMNAHVSKPVEMKVLEKTIRSIKSGGHRNNQSESYKF